MKNHTILDIKLSAIIKIVVVLAIVWVLIQLHSIIVILFIAFIVATAVRPVVKRLEGYRIPRAISIPLLYILIICVLGSLLYLIAHPFAYELSNFGHKLPETINNIQDKIPFLSGVDFAGMYSNISSKLSSSGTGLGDNLGTAFKAVTGIFDIFTSLLTIVIISLYLSLGLDEIVAGLLNFVPKEYRSKVLSNYARVEEQVGAWLRGELFLMLAIGITVFIVLKILSIPFALPLAVFAGLMEILPIVGPLVYSVAIILVALTVSPVTAVISAISCLAIQQTEGHILVPLTMKKAVGLSPVMTIIAILGGASLLGIVGALIAVPAAAVIVAIVKDIYIIKD